MSTNDQWLAVLVGGGVMVTLRVLDFFIPRGWVSKWTRTHAEKDEKKKTEEQDGSEDE